MPEEPPVGLRGKYYPEILEHPEAPQPQFSKRPPPEAFERAARSAKVGYQLPNLPEPRRQYGRYAVENGRVVVSVPESRAAVSKSAPIMRRWKIEQQEQPGLRLPPQLWGTDVPWFCKPTMIGKPLYCPRTALAYCEAQPDEDIWWT